MSAVVTVSFYRGTKVEVPRVDNYEVTASGNLRLRQGWQEWTAEFIAGQWDAVEITPERGPDGRFVKKGR